LRRRGSSSGGSENSSALTAASSSAFGVHLSKAKEHIEGTTTKVFTLLDLAELLVAEPSDLQALIDELTSYKARERIRVVASEQSIIALLNEAGITSLVSVHRDIGNAVDTHHLVGGRRPTDPTHPMNSEPFPDRDPAGELNASQRSAIDARQADQDRTLAAILDLETALATAAPGSCRSRWIDGHRHVTVAAAPVSDRCRHD
jgi:hypothetical protein